MAGNSKAVLFLRSRKYKVQVLEMSRDAFSICVPKSIANSLTVGVKPKLLYQEMLWQVECVQKWPGENGLMEVELLQLAELTQPKLQGAAAIQAGPTRAIQNDSSLIVAFGVALILMVLIMPAWGGHWGTSDAICNAAQTTFNVVCDMLSFRR
jgi:hypothetical protein